MFPIQKDQKPFQCGLCSISFSINMQLVGHVQAHSLTKPFQCGYCKVSYDKNAELKLHVETHKLFICVPTAALTATGVVQLGPSGQLGESDGCGSSERKAGKRISSLKRAHSSLAGDAAPTKDQQLQEENASSIAKSDVESKGLSKAADRSEASAPNSELAVTTSDSCKEMDQTRSHATLEMTVEDILDDERDDQCRDFDADADDVASTVSGEQRDGACGAPPPARMKGPILSEKQSEAAQLRVVPAGSNPEETSVTIVAPNDGRSNRTEGAASVRDVLLERQESALGTPNNLEVNTAVGGLERVSENKLMENADAERRKENLSACGVCDLRFHASQHLSAHWVSQHRTCSLCGESCLDPPKLSNHLKLTHGLDNSHDRPFLCALCGVGFDLAKSVSDHVRIVHAEGGHLHYTGRCPPPDSADAPKDAAQSEVIHVKQLKQEFSLETSDVVEAPAVGRSLGSISEDSPSDHAGHPCHTNTEPGAAEHKVFMQERQETTEQPPADTPCAAHVEPSPGGETVAQVSKVSRRKLTEQLLVCGVCDMRFCAPKSLSVHWISWHNACNYCGESFLEPPKLCKHIRLVHGQDSSFDRPFLCALCGRGFRVAGYVSVHIRMVHIKEDGQLRCTQRCPPRAEKAAAENEVPVEQKQQDCSQRTVNEVELSSMGEALGKESEDLQMTPSPTPRGACHTGVKQEHAENEVAKEERQDREQCSLEPLHAVHGDPSSDSEGKPPGEICRKPWEKQKEQPEHFLACGVCDARFHAPKQLLAHWKLEHDTCNFCGDTFKEPQTLCSHLTSVHGQDEIFVRPFLCAVCGAGFKIASYICDHIRLVHNRRPAKLRSGCIRHPYCRNALSRTDANKGTELMKEEKQEPSLGTSDTVTNYSADETPEQIAEDHKMENAEEQKEQVLVCGVCGTCFFSARHLSDHWASEHGTCKFCDKKFFAPRKLCNHVKLVHCRDVGSDRPFLCAVCGACSHIARYLLDHIRFTHRKQDDQSSDTLSSASGPTHHPDQTAASDSQSSSKTQNNSRTFRCKDCSATFSFRCQLNDHVNDLHRRKRPYQCPACGENFETRHQLQYHFRKHDSSEWSCFELEGSSESEAESVGILQQDCLVQMNFSDSTTTDSVTSLQAEEQRLDSVATDQDAPVRTAAQLPGNCVTTVSVSENTQEDDPVQGAFAPVFSDSTSTILQFVASAPGGQTQGADGQLSSDSAAMGDTLQGPLARRAFVQIPSDSVMVASGSVATLQKSLSQAHDGGYPNPMQPKSGPPESGTVLFVGSKDVSDRPRLQKETVEYKCPDCPQVFIFQRALRKHSKTAHGSDRVFCCPHCPWRFATTSRLCNHVNSQHSSARPFQCSVCKESFKTKKRLKTHIFRQHSAAGTGISRNRVKKSPERSGSTKVCHSRGISQSPSQVEDMSNVCHFCGKCFASLNYARHHINVVHLKVKPHKCNLCSKTFSTTHSLMLHTRVHAEERLFTCDVCGKSFIKKNTLTYHRNTHTNAKPYHCKVCHKGFNAHSGLTVHLRRHAGNKCYSCSTCGKRFYAHSNMKKHTLTHTDLRTLSCRQCGKTYRSSGSLKYHLEHSHPPL